jgi:hypothetical protein
MTNFLLLLLLLPLLLLCLVPPSSSRGGGGAPTTCSAGDAAAAAPPPPPPVATLAWLAHPLAARVLLDVYFERRPVHLARRDGSYHSMLSHAWDSVNGNVGFRARGGAYMAARATKRGVDVQPFQYWRAPEVVETSTAAEVAAGQKTSDRHAAWDPDALLHLHREGFTLQYPAIEGHAEKQKQKMKKTKKKKKKIETLRLREFATTLTNALGAYTRLNMYVTPPGQQGFKSHFDSHDVYVLQIQGKKRWRVFAVPLVAHPVSDWGEKKLARARSSLGEPLLDVVIQPGDALFIPRGFVHEADCLDADLDTVAVHITVAVNTVKVADAVFLASRFCLSGEPGSADALQRLKRVLRQRAASDEVFRRSAAPLCGGSEEGNVSSSSSSSPSPSSSSCGTPTDVVMAAFRTAVEDAFAADQDAMLREKLVKNPSAHLAAALRWTRRKMRAGMKFPKQFSLSKIQPITHAMHEHRPPKRLKQKE